MGGGEKGKGWSNQRVDIGKEVRPVQGLEGGQVGKWVSGIEK